MNTLPTVTCRVCGTENRPTRLFCSNCGNYLQAEGEDTWEELPPRSVVIPADPPPDAGRAPGIIADDWRLRRRGPRPATASPQGSPRPAAAAASSAWHSSCCCSPLRARWGRWSTPRCSPAVARMETAVRTRPPLRDLGRIAIFHHRRDPGIDHVVGGLRHHGGAGTVDLAGIRRRLFGAAPPRTV